MSKRCKRAVPVVSALVFAGVGAAAFTTRRPAVIAVATLAGAVLASGLGWVPWGRPFAGGYSKGRGNDITRTLTKVAAAAPAADVTSVIERAHAAWEADKHPEAIRLYAAALEAARATGDDPGSLPPTEHLQCHANLGSSYMQLAAEKPHPGARLDLATREALLAASLQHWQVADRCGPASPLLNFFLASVSRDLSLASATRRITEVELGPEAVKGTPSLSNVGPGDLKLENIEKRSAKNLSHVEFVEQYLVPGVPVVITGLAVPQWNLDFLEEQCGDKIVPRVKHEPTNAGEDWAALGSTERVPLRDHLQELRKADANSAGAPMLFDHALSELCPELLEDLVIPRYFAVDYLRTIPLKEREGLWPAPGRFPSLFAQPAGSRCGVHVDQAGTHFYQMLISGKKRWRIFKPEHTPRLYPRGHGLLFEADTFADDMAQFPLLATTPVYEAVLEPGDTIFVPQNTPHQVLNEETSVAISSNYIAGVGLDKSLAELNLLSQGGARPEYVKAMEALRRYAPKPDAPLPEDPGDLRWKDFDAALWFHKN